MSIDKQAEAPSTGKPEADPSRDKQERTPNIDRHAMLLYAVTDRSWLGKGSTNDCSTNDGSSSDGSTNDCSLEAAVEEAIKGGATLIQLREKTLDTKSLGELAVRLMRITKRYSVPLIVNDNTTAAALADADGVHVGQGDMSTKECRKLIGKGKILGVSAQTAAQAVAAQEDGADYIGVGAVFSTSTKADADNVSLETLREICSSVDIPVVAIGGICSSNIQKLAGSGISGVAVVSAIFAAPNIREAAEELRGLAKEVVR